MSFIDKNVIIEITRIIKFYIRQKRDNLKTLILNNSDGQYVDGFSRTKCNLTGTNM